MPVAKVAAERSLEVTNARCVSAQSGSTPCAADQFHPEARFQPGPQSHREAVLRVGSGVCYGWHGSVVVDAHPPGMDELCDSGVAFAFKKWRSRKRDDAGILSAIDDHARHDHGLFCAYDGAVRGLRQLLFADPGRGRGHAVSALQHDVILGHVRGVPGASVFVLRWPGTHPWRLDTVRAAERTGRSYRPRPGVGSGPLGDIHCDVLRGPVAGLLELHHHYAGYADQGHEPVAVAAQQLELVHYFLHGPDGFRRADASLDPPHS